MKRIGTYFSFIVLFYRHNRPIKVKFSLEQAMKAQRGSRV
jgi:hypothetical protein